MEKRKRKRKGQHSKIKKGKNVFTALNRNASIDTSFTVSRKASHIF